mmetsp:Transcript_22864/g.29820  ORF Transcript_22864/g.29820 Transcript_22864/m.29820 type:complete len:739 (-) Transcript_22864:226-2442(-)
MIVIGSMTPGASNDLSVPRSLESMSEPELIKIINDQKELIFNYEKEMKQLKTDLDIEKNQCLTLEKTIETLTLSNYHPPDSPKTPWSPSIHSTDNDNEPLSPFSPSPPSPPAVSTTTKSLPPLALSPSNHLNRKEEEEKELQKLNHLINHEEVSFEQFAPETPIGHREGFGRNNEGKNKNNNKLKTLRSLSTTSSASSLTSTTAIPTARNKTIPSNTSSNHSTSNNTTTANTPKGKFKTTNGVNGSDNNGKVTTSRPKVMMSKQRSNNGSPSSSPNKTNNTQNTQKSSHQNEVLTLEEKMFSKSKASQSPLRNRKPSPISTTGSSTGTGGGGVDRSPRISPKARSSRSTTRVSLRKYGASNTDQQTTSSSSSLNTKNNNHRTKSPQRDNDNDNNDNSRNRSTPRLIQKQSSSSSSQGNRDRLIQTRKSQSQTRPENLVNILGDDTLESKIMNGVPEPSFEQKLLQEHRKSERIAKRQSQSQERNGGPMMLVKQTSLEEKVMTDKYITVLEAEAFHGTGSMCLLTFENRDIHVKLSNENQNESEHFKLREDMVSTMRNHIATSAYSHLILCGALNLVTPSEDAKSSLSLLPDMLKPAKWPTDKYPTISAFVRRSELQNFRQLWGKFAIEKEIQISLYGVPDRLTQQQVALYVFNRTQATNLALFPASLSNFPTPQPESLLEKVESCGAPTGCHITLFLPVAANNNLNSSSTDQANGSILYNDIDMINQRSDVTLVYPPN